MNSKQFACLVSISLGLVALGSCNASAAVVTVSTSAPTGTQNVANDEDYIGLLSSVSPTTQIGGADITHGNSPAGEVFLVGDLTGRDMNASGGGRTWTYELILPADAAPGTGFTNIEFNAHVFERANDNLEDVDQLRWQMFINGGTTAVDSETLTNDITSDDINLLHTPGATVVTSIEVVFDIEQYNEIHEWFVTRGTLMADYDQVMSVPEPSGMLLTMFVIPLWLRRRRTAHKCQFGFAERRSIRRARIAIV